jgi:integrase
VITDIERDTGERQHHTPFPPAPISARFPARPRPVSWPATRQSRKPAFDRLTRTPFLLPSAGSQKQRRRGLAALLDWLDEQPGDSWQGRWLASGADTAGANWRRIPAQWLRVTGQAQGLIGPLGAALTVAICADVLRPSTTWFVAAVPRGGALARGMADTRDAAGFARLRQACDRDDHLPAAAGRHTLHRAAVVLGAHGGLITDITVGDALELLDTECTDHRKPMAHGVAFYRALHQAGILQPDAPARLKELRSTGQRTPAELIDQFNLACRPIRDLLVDYLAERQPRLDYSSLRSLAANLGNMFWKDLERHHPDINSLDLSPKVATAWKQRLRTRQKMTTTADGVKTAVTVDRIGYRQLLTPIRAFYLDLAQWALEDPARWGPWVARCPVGEEEVNQRKAARHRKSRMDARTRERLPVLPVLVRAVDERRKTTEALLHAARRTSPGDRFTAAGQTLIRAITKNPTNKIWAHDPAGGRPRDLAMEEDLAFWAWAAVEVLRSTGVRIEELLEITHHSLVQYRLPSTGELVPLLQITPSKTDSERLLVVSPELADVLSAVISRVRGGSTTVPVIPAYDRAECLWLAPAPWLFQRRLGTEHRRICCGAIRNMLNAALAHSPLTDPTTGGPLRFTPHDFRRIFITDAIMSGLPPHIAQIIAGHQDINVTLGYKAVYPEEAIQAHLAFLARRRALRPSEEYRVPTDAEWTEFLGHFERRKVSTGTCGRAFGTACIHEHACIRCSMHWPDPAQRDRLTDIRDNLTARIAEAEREGWLGEVEGLKISLAGAEDKLAQIERRTPNQHTVHLGIPALTRDR